MEAETLHLYVLQRNDRKTYTFKQFTVLHNNLEGVLTLLSTLCAQCEKLAKKLVTKSCSSLPFRRIASPISDIDDHTAFLAGKLDQLQLTILEGQQQLLQMLDKRLPEAAAATATPTLPLGISFSPLVLSASSSTFQTTI